MPASRRFTTVTLVTLVLAGAGAQLPPQADAQLDHLICRTVKDPAILDFYANFVTELQPEFKAATCRIDRKATQFCAPATKTGVNPEPPGTIAGVALATDFLVYKVKCSAQAKPPKKLVDDQFGSRLMTFGSTTTVLVPAIKRNPPCGGTSATATVPTCGGECPPDEACVLVGSACRCQAPPQECGRDAAGVCGGECPAQGEACQITPNGECRCGSDTACGPLNTAPICGGTCPAGEYCKTYQTPEALDCACMAP